MTDTSPAGSTHLTPTRRLQHLGLMALMGIAALNIWTGSPLVALWVGSQAQGSGHPTMTSVFVVVIVMAAISFGLVVLLQYLERVDDRITGHTAKVSIHAPWLRSMRGEQALYPGEQPRLNGLERVLVTMVVLVVVIFEVWFLLFSTSPIDGRSGRGDASPSSPDFAQRPSASHALPRETQLLRGVERAGPGRREAIGRQPTSDRGHRLTEDTYSAA